MQITVYYFEFGIIIMMIKTGDIRVKDDLDCGSEVSC